MRSDVILPTLMVLIVISTLLPLYLYDHPSISIPVASISVTKTLRPEPSSVSGLKGISNTKNSTILHFLVSSGCSRYQFWQVVTQIHSAKSVNQQGRYTWIASGCPLNESRDKEILTRDQMLQQFEAHFSAASLGSLQSASLHFSPDYSNMSVYGGPFADGTKKRTFLNRKGKIQVSNYGNKYHFNNKPNGLLHWAKTCYNGKPFIDEAIVLIDPDFLFMAPFELPVRVSPGKPAAASYGLGGQWLEFNLTIICGEDSHCTNRTTQDVRRHYSAGPPYIVHARDVIELSTWWSKFVPPTYDQYPLLYAEMFAYSMAAAHLQLPHKLLNGLFTGCMVGFPSKSNPPEPSAQTFVEAGSDYSNTQSLEGPSSCFLPPLAPPPLLHYCQRYAFENPSNESRYLFLAKRRVPHDVMDCDSPTEFLKPFPSNQSESTNDQHWKALAVCAIVRAVNYAKHSHCSKTP